MLLVTLAVAASVVAPVAATAAADDKTILLIYADARLIPAIVSWARTWNGSGSRCGSVSPTASRACSATSSSSSR